MATFKGQRVMLSRTLVPPEMFDMLRGVLTENGADVCLCSNPEYNSSSDFHVLPSWDSEKFAELQAHGCQIVGPECILRCAKLRKVLPSSGYTCCLTFDGIRILSTGFEGSEKTRLHQLVIAMCGEFCTKAAMDVDFVIAKDVLTPKYKWAAFTLRKPILSIQWLDRCFREHRRVPHEPYRLRIFTGILLCTTGIQLEQRNKIAELVAENGGTLRADLTRECTHLITKSPESDKYKVAKMHWKHIKCVNEDWFWNSLSEKVCLEEGSYDVGEGTSYVPKVPPGPLPNQDTCSQDVILPGPVPAVVLRSFSEEAIPAERFRAPVVDPDIPESDVQGRQGGDLPISADGYQMYLSGCRFFLTGFDLVEMRRLVRMVLSGGGTRYVAYNDRVTHVVLGKPSESELKDIREKAMWGAVDIVFPTWLEECTRQRREVALSPQFTVPETLLLDSSYWKIPFPGQNKTGLVQEKKSAGESTEGRVLHRKLDHVLQAQRDAGADVEVSQDNDAKQQPLNSSASNAAGHPRKDIHDSEPAAPQVLQKQTPELFYPGGRAGTLAQVHLNDTVTSSAGCEDTRCDPNTTNASQDVNSGAKEGVFKGLVFGFAPSFEACMRAEVVQWVLEGGGVMLGDVGSSKLLQAQYIIFPHGAKKDSSNKSHIRSVTTQWIKYCLEESTLLDINSHILFQPLSCEVPLPGFQTLRFALTQYTDRERVLLYNLCHVLGAKYQEKKMNKRATHLLCKVGGGEKYEAALQWGVEVVTAEWLYACVAQNRVVLPDPYRPKKLTPAEKEAGLGIPTQNPFQLTAHDTAVPFTERCTAENNAEVPVSAKENEIGGVEIKGKTLNTKKKSSLRAKLQALEGNRPLITSKNGPLTSQNGRNLDPWDELTASWATESGTRRTTRSRQKAVTPPREPSSNVPGAVGLGGTQNELGDDPKQGDEPTLGSQGTDDYEKVHTSANLNNTADPPGPENEEDDSSRDVAAAIEGLLAQTSKVQSEDSCRSPGGNRDLLAHDLIRGRRNGDDMRERANFKRPKLVSNRSIESGADQPVQSIPPAGESYDKFEESQMESQVVAYHEDHSEKQRIMERVRTRSMSTSSSSGSGESVQRKETSWKATAFKRLLKAADANK